VYVTTWSAEARRRHRDQRRAGLITRRRYPFRGRDVNHGALVFMSADSLAINSPMIMGILNLTPDSFSDGGQFDSVASAVQAGISMVEAGANIIDIGGESTRPGAERISLEVELERVIPVIGQLSAQAVYVSIDTTRSEVAKAAVAAGAQMVNDVSGGLSDPQMFEVVASLGVPIVLMHWRGPSKTMQENIHYENALAEVCSELQNQAELACSAGIRRGNIILDPGIGFGKEAEHNWDLLKNIRRSFDAWLPVARWCFTQEIPGFTTRRT